MRFGLLVVLALVALVPSLTNGRIVSKCELKEKLEKAIRLPHRFERFRETIVARVICTVGRISHQNTDMVRVIGRRRTTTARPTTVANVTKAGIIPTTARQAPPANTTGRQAPPANTTGRQAPPANTTGRQAPPAPTTAGQAPPANTTAGQAPPAPTTSGQAPPAPTTAGQTTAGPAGGTSSQPAQTRGSSRRKRAAEPPIDSDVTGESQEEEDEQEVDDPEEEELERADNQMEDNEEEEEEEEGGDTTSEVGGGRNRGRSNRGRFLKGRKDMDNRAFRPDRARSRVGKRIPAGSSIDSDEAGDSQEEEDEEEVDNFDEEELERADNQTDEDEDEEEEVGEDEEEGEGEMTPEDGGERKKRSLRRRYRGRARGSPRTRSLGRRRGGRRTPKPWSLGFYGLFQLRDSFFCNSGYRSSRNVCNITCNAFTDEDIMNDVECLAKSGYWWSLFRNAPRSCRIRVRKTRNFFSECY